MFKKYQHTQLVNIPEYWWTHGYCSIFAYALHERYGTPMYAVVEEAESDGHRTLYHAFVVLGDMIYDADGASLLAEAIGNCDKIFYLGEKSELKLIPVTLEYLGDLHDVDVEDTNDAHDFIDQHIERFIALSKGFYV